MNKTTSNKLHHGKGKLVNRKIIGRREGKVKEKEMGVEKKNHQKLL